MARLSLPDDYAMDRHFDGVASRLPGVAQHHRHMLKEYMRVARERIAELEGQVVLKTRFEEQQTSVRARHAKRPSVYEQITGLPCVRCVFEEQDERAQAERKAK